MMKLPLFFRHLLSYITVFVIPVMVLGYFSYTHFTSIVTENFNQSREEALMLIGDQLDSKMTDAINISQQLSQNYDLKPHTMDTFNGFYFSAQRLNYPSANSFFHEILYYVRDGDYLFSSRGTYRLPLFFNHIYQYEELQYDDFINLINHSNSKKVRGAEKILVNNQYTQNFLTITVPIPLNSPRPYGTALFLVEENKMRDMLRSFINYPGGDILVYDQNGEILMTLSDQSKTASQEVWGNVKDLSDQTNLEMSIDGTDYLVTSVQSEYTNWMLTVLTPKSHLIGPVKEFQQQSLRILAIVLITGFLIIYFMMYLNYNPLRKLISFTEEIWPRLSGRGYSGLDTVYATIKELDSASHKLISQVNQSRDAVRQYCYFQLLKGMEEETSHALTRLEEYGCVISGSRWYVAIVELEESDKEDTQSAQRVEYYIDHHILHATDAYRVDMADPRMLVWIVSAEGQVVWKQSLSDVLHKVDITIGIGNPVDQLHNISRSYMQAHNAIQHKQLLGINKVIFFSDIHTEQHEIDWKPLHQLDTLRSFIREGYSSKLANLASSIATEIESNSPNLFIAKCLVVEVLQNVMREMKRVDPKYMLKHPDVLTLVNYNRMKDLKSLIETVISHAADYLSQISDHRDPKLQNMIDYIEGNFTDPQFSLQQIADQFHCSTKHANMYFKKHMNISIMEYVHQKRFDKVKGLLANQDMKIQDIVSKVGYHDSSSFIRKFKKIVGCTPGQYRKYILQSELTAE